LDYAQNQAQQYVNKAKETIKELSENSEKQEILNQLADYLINRSN
jgi:geranylgeranyl pyrophosphate synthase